MKSQFAYVRIFLYLEYNEDINFSGLSPLIKLQFPSKMELHSYKLSIFWKLQLMVQVHVIGQEQVSGHVAQAQISVE